MVEHGRQDFLETGRLQKTPLDVIGNERVEPFHRHRAALAAGVTLSSLGRAGVIPILAALAGAQRHRLAAGGTEADAGEHCRTADDARRRQRRTTGLEQRLYGLEVGRVDDRRHGHLDHLGVWLSLARLPELRIEPMAADVGRTRQHFVDGADAPTSPISGVDAGGIEVLGDRLDAHRTRAAVAFVRQAEDQPHGLGLDWIDL